MKRTRYNRDRRALLMVRYDDMERSPFYAPPNFYEWSQKAKEHYMNRHFPGWTSVCNGTPWPLGGRDVVNYHGELNRLNKQPNGPVRIRDIATGRKAA